MGLMRFLVSPESILEDWPEAQEAYISGLDGHVFASRIEIEGNIIGCRRQASDSGKFHISWPVEGFGRPIIQTCSLSERERPFILALELARGKLAVLRDQQATWELAGMALSDEYRTCEREAFRLFRESATAQDDPAECSQLADLSLAKSFEASEILVQLYTEQRLRLRRLRSAQPPTLLGCRLGEAFIDNSWGEKFAETFNAAGVPVEWRLIEPREGEYDWSLCDAHVEWCHDHRLFVFGGPLLDLSPGGLPKWLETWESDFLNLQSFICDFIETAVSRYIGRIRNWEVVAHPNTGGALALGEENRLTLVARVLDVARQVDEENKLYLKIDQPWGAYQANGQHRLSPFQFVDALLRSGIGLSGINLEIAPNFTPHGSGSHDLISLSRLIDLWSLLGIPLQVTLAFPTSSKEDPKAHKSVSVRPGTWRRPLSDSTQAEWVDLVIPLLMAKHAVVAVYWTHFSDAHPHHFPNAGLMANDGAFKPANKRILLHRKQNDLRQPSRSPA